MARQSTSISDELMKELLEAQVQSLAQDLAEAKASGNRSLSLLRTALISLLGSFPLINQDAEEKLVTLRRTLALDPLDPVLLDDAVRAFKDTVQSSAFGQEGAGGAPGVEVKADRPQHRATAEEIAPWQILIDTIIKEMPSGLGQAYTQSLQGNLRDLLQYREDGDLSAVAVCLGTIVEQFSDAMLDRQQKAETALREVVLEVVSIESDIKNVFSDTADKLSNVGDQYDQQLTADIGNLVKDITQANSLETLKGQAVERIRTMREVIKSHRNQERALISETKGEMERLSHALLQAKQRMVSIEEDSKRLNTEAMTCSLTKLLNKRALNRMLASAMANESDWPICMIVFDLDKFKNINDQYGHLAGDRALQAIAAHVGKQLRPTDLFFRYGGDEFVVLLLATSLDFAQMVAERIRGAAEKIRFTHKGQELLVTVSLGLSEAKQEDSIDSFFERADQALLAAKQAGRNRIIVSA